jgi:hypothetical protein
VQTISHRIYVVRVVRIESQLTSAMHIPGVWPHVLRVEQHRYESCSVIPLRVQCV